MDKERICIDTSILIDYYRKKNKEKAKFVQLSRKYSFSISVISKLEVLTGITENQKNFLKNFFEKIDIIPLGEREIEFAAEIIRYLTKRNKIIGIKDILIGSTAISKGLKLSTLNKKDFERIDNLELIDK
ncbi:MAG: type II toxin-antitoxin system VapC family toxin [Bacteroidales bacterium]|nr:type II toxin-antitoxin system VapC family toxin [Bacteroidales bacterium]